MSDSVVSQVVGITSAKEAWDRLAIVYASESKTQIRQLKHQLHHLTRNTDDIATYMQRAKHIFDQLIVLQSDGTQIPIAHSSSSSFSIHGHNFTLKDILHVPNLCQIYFSCTIL